MDNNRNTVYSGLKIFRHVDSISGMLEGKRIAPIYLRIKPTNVCNQKCFFCAYANDNIFDDRKTVRESIPWDILRQALVDFSEMGGKAITFSGGGEPLCYANIAEALELTKRLHLDCSMITNGQDLNGENIELLADAKWIRVSFDTCQSETYKKIRKVDTFDQVVSNIEQFARKKNKDCVLGINCVISKENAEEIFSICKLAKEIGIDNVKLSPILVKENVESYHREIEKVVSNQITEAKQKLEDKKFKIIDKYSDDYALNDNYVKPYHRCYIQEYFAVIAADSKIYRCHQRAYTKAGEIGDLSKKSFKEIWYDPQIIEEIRKFNPSKQCHMRCAFDERNCLLNDFLMMDTNHVNFV